MTPRDLEQTLRALLQQSRDDASLRRELETLAAQEISFSGFTWLYGPLLYRRNRLLFRPFILSHFSSILLLPKWRVERVRWKGDRAAILESWLTEVDRADDFELFHRLYDWKLNEQFGSTAWKAREQQIFTDLRAQLERCQRPSQRPVVLRKFDVWFRLTEEQACWLYSQDPASLGPYILRRLPAERWGREKRGLWTRLLVLADQQKDESFRWSLYRRQVDLDQWRRDALSLCRSIPDPIELGRELDRRHPEGWGLDLGEVFLQLLTERGRELFPYLAPRLRQVWRGWLTRGQYGKMADFAAQKGWWDFWAALVRTCSSGKEFNSTVRSLVDSRELPEATVQERLLALAGVSREWNWPGLGLATVHQLEEGVALALYQRFPSLVRGPYRLHVQANLWGERYPKLLEHFIAVRDEELIDHLASRLVTRSGRWGNAAKLLEEADRLADYYAALKSDEAEFGRRAARVLGAVPAYSIYQYGPLIRENRLARLLFERSAALYLADPRSLADLVEAAEIHVMSVAYRALGLPDERARIQAAYHLPLLLGTLLRPLQRETRSLAFGALANAADSVDTARIILDRARDALNLPDKKYPKERLLGLMARLLHQYPELRGPREQPVVFERKAA